MSGVVLRCPNCGTVKGGPGECDACSEATVRPYCTNHEPGRWLDGPACPACGARLGDPPRPAARAPSAPPRPRPTPTRPPARPAPPPVEAPPRATISLPRPPGSGGWLRDAARGPWARGRPSRPAPPSSPEAGFPPARRRVPASLPELLEAARAARERRRGPERPAAASPGSFLLGLVRRLVLLALFLLVATAVMGLLAGGPFLEILLTILLNAGR